MGKKGMEEAKEAATEALTKKKKAELSGCSTEAAAAAKASEAAKEELANVEAREVKLAKLVTDEKSVKKAEKDAEKNKETDEKKLKHERNKEEKRSAVCGCAGEASQNNQGLINSRKPSFQSEGQGGCRGEEGEG